ncbi:MAG: TGS domain-containing protein, partial [Candidatus Nanoarchaeia archaeon]
TTDCLLIIINNLEQLDKTLETLKTTQANKLIILNPLQEIDKRKTRERIKSKYPKLNFLISPNQEEIKQHLFNLFIPSRFIRVYTKEPRKSATKQPLLLTSNSTIEDMAEKILKGMSKKIKQIKIWGPSSSFPSQTVGLEHKLKDKDIVELHVN